MTTKKLPSRITVEGLDRAPHRAFLRALGLTDGDLKKPFVGVASTDGRVTPCNALLGELAREACAAVRDGKKVSPRLPRFDLWRQYEPGRHHVVIDLDDLRRGGRFPPIDMRRIQSFHLVAFDNKPRDIQFLSAYLVP